MRWLVLAWVGVYVSLSGCASAPRQQVDVQNEYISTGDGPYETFVWLAGGMIINDPEGQWEPVNIDSDAEFRAEIESRLKALGYRPLKAGEAENPDIGLTYFAGRKVTPISPNLNDSQYKAIQENMAKGALIFIVSDLETGQPIMVSTASASMKRNSTIEEMRERIEIVSEKLFVEFPAAGNRVIQDRVRSSDY